ncbi:MAG: hypothetical protein ABI360_01050, partial [Allobranchiibius sp.]
MKRNTALFGTSAAVGVVAAAALVATATSSVAAPAPALGIAYSTTTGSSDFRTGTTSDPDGLFTATASVVGTTARVTAFAMPLLKVSGISVVTSCTGAAAQTVVSGGGAAGTYTSKTTISAAKFTGNGNAVGSVTLLPKFGVHTVGASYDLSTSGLGEYIQLGAVNCDVVTSSSSSSTGSSSSSSSSTGSSPTTSSRSGP